MEERTETVTRRRRQDGVWGRFVDGQTPVTGAGKSTVWMWPQRDQYEQGQEGSDVTDPGNFGELQASIEQNINQPVRQESMIFSVHSGKKSNSYVTHSLELRRS